MGGLWLTTTQIWVYDGTAVIFSDKCSQPTKTLFSVRKHLRKTICFILYICTYWRAFSERLSSTVNCTFTDIQFKLLLAKNIQSKDTVFRCSDKAFYIVWNFCLNKPHWLQSSYSKLEGLLIIQGWQKVSLKTKFTLTLSDDIPRR